MNPSRAEAGFNPYVSLEVLVLMTFSQQEHFYKIFKELFFFIIKIYPIHRALNSFISNALSKVSRIQTIGTKGLIQRDITFFAVNMQSIKIHARVGFE